MSIIDEGKQIRTEVAKLRPDKRRRYGEALRRRILDWLARCNAEGMPDFECSKLLGIKVNRFTVWRRHEARVADADREALALVPIESPLPGSSAVTLISPSGYRVVGLELGQLAALLRGLA